MTRTPLALALAAVLAAGPRVSAADAAVLDRLPGRGAVVPDTGKFTFAILGDRRGGGDENWPIFDRAVDEINLTRPDFVMTVGDFIPGYSQDTVAVDSMWRDFWSHAGRLDSPLLLLPGNHDVTNAKMLAYWRRHLGRTYYSFDYRGCHFVVLNTNEVPGDQPPYLGAQQTAWAVQDLAAHGSARQTFLFLHQPIWKEGYNPAEFGQIERALGDRRYTVFAGHEHQLQPGRRNSHRYFILATTGGGIDPMEAPEAGVFHHYTTVTVEGDSAYIAIRQPGKVWREDIAILDLEEKLRQAVVLDAEPPRGLDGPRATTGFSATIGNPVGRDTLTATLRLQGLAPDGWRSNADGGGVTVAPGDTGRFRAAFSVPTDRLFPPPTMRISLIPRRASD